MMIWIAIGILFLIGWVSARNARRMRDENLSIYELERLRQMSKMEDM
jgi:hypothetical protein